MGEQAGAAAAAADDAEEAGAEELGSGPVQKRWLILALFASVSAANAAHWLQFAIIAGVAQRFYRVGATAINWTSTIFMAMYVPLVFPASWLTDRKGLRVAVAAGAGLTALGGWLKMAGAAPTRFGVAFTGQALVGAGQMFTLGAPARLASLWFPPRQVATATAIGVFGNQVGIALGFLLPPAIVGPGEDDDVTSWRLLGLYSLLAVFPTALFLLVLWKFDAAPPWPPMSQAQLQARALALAAQERALEQALPVEEQEQQPLRAGNDVKEPPGRQVQIQETTQQQEETTMTFVEQLRLLISNRDFVLLWAAYGLNVGVFYAVSTLLAQMLLAHFEEAEEQAGHVGLTMVVAGVMGSVAGGIALDRWPNSYKQVTLGVYAMALGGLLAFSFSLRAGNLGLVYAASAFLGFFTAGYLGVGYEYAAALTYPVPESTSSGILNAASEVFGILVTLAAGELLNVTGDRVTNLVLVAALAAGFLLSAFVRGRDLRRGAALPLPPATDAVEPLRDLPPEKFLA